MPDNFLATNISDGDLRFVPECFLLVEGVVGGSIRVDFRALPEISDSKSVRYSDQPIQGRAAPVKTYAYSENRTISFTMHIYVTKQEDIRINLGIIRLIDSLAHPQYENSYLPPRVARLKCGKLLSEDELGVPVVLKSYEIQYDNSVQWFWDEGTQTYMPLHVAIPCQFDVVYSWTSLPGAESVLRGNY
jgi:hypothetical protein